MSVLGMGQSFGRASRRWYGDSFVLSPVIHDAPKVNVAHAHEAAFVTMMLDGAYTENAGRKAFRFDRFTAVYHPSGLEHQDFVGASGVRLLMFEFRPELLAGIGVGREERADLRDLTGTRSAFELLSLYRDALSDADPLEFESRALALVGRVVSPSHRAARDLPSLRRAQEYLHAHFNARVTMTDVSRAAGVHPVYLGQMFHREMGETVGRYVTRLRVRAAADQLSSSDIPLSAIAFELGFCDQSHLQRAFKKTSGFTLAEFRRSFSSTTSRRARSHLCEAASQLPE